MKILEKCRTSIIPGLEELVVDAYTQSHRKYHDLDHIEEIWRIFQEDYASQFSEEDQTMFFYATVFHDFVYDVGNPSNEIQSANAFLDFFKMRSPFTARSISEVYYTIVGSRNHWDPANDILPNWGKLFLDIDIYHLGSSKEKYQENGRKIFEEFSSKFTEQEVYKGRETWLQGVLKNRKLYRTMGVIREDQARKNMQEDLNDCIEYLGRE